MRMFYLERACSMQVRALAGGAATNWPNQGVPEKTAIAGPRSVRRHDGRDGMAGASPQMRSRRSELQELEPFGSLVLPTSSRLHDAAILIWGYNNEIRRRTIGQADGRHPLRHRARSVYGRSSLRERNVCVLPPHFAVACADHSDRCLRRKGSARCDRRPDLCGRRSVRGQPDAADGARAEPRRVKHENLAKATSRQGQSDIYGRGDCDGNRRNLCPGQGRSRACASRIRTA